MADFSMNFVMMVFIPTLILGVMFLTKARFRLKKGDGIFKVLVNVTGSAILFIDLAIYVSGVLV
jgi:hypothetical protein